VVVALVEVADHAPHPVRAGFLAVALADHPEAVASTYRVAS
jgi:hypothetical protein